MTTYSDYQFMCGMEGEKGTLWGFLLYVLAERLARFICRVRGHDMVDTSYGGPDCGWASAHCNRCGYSFHVTLY